MTKLTINILTLFPDIYTSYLSVSFIRRYIEKNVLFVKIYDMRIYARAQKLKIDDKCYGIHKGMLMKFDSFSKIFDQIKPGGRLIHPSPGGNKFSQSIARTLINDHEEFTFICSRYDGIDQRIVDKFNVLELCIGDYVLFDGDTACMVIMNVLARLCFAKDRSLSIESFNTPNTIEHAQYTTPREYNGMKVPPELLSGNHALIEKWCYKSAIERQKQNRPDLSH